MANVIGLRGRIFFLCFRVGSGLFQLAVGIFRAGENLSGFKPGCESLPLGTDEAEISRPVQVSNKFSDIPLQLLPT